MGETIQLRLVFPPYTSFVLYRFLRTLQQKRAQSTFLYSLKNYITKLLDNKIVRLAQVFEGLEISSVTNILCNSVEIMTT